MDSAPRPARFGPRERASFTFALRKLLKTRRLIKRIRAYSKRRKLLAQRTFQLAREGAKDSILHGSFSSPVANPGSAQSVLSIRAATPTQSDCFAARAELSVEFVRRI